MNLTDPARAGRKPSPQAGREPSWSATAYETLLAALLVLALLLMQGLIGGTRLVLAFPALTVLAVLGVLGLGLVRLRRPDPGRFCLAATLLFLGYIIVRAALSPAAYLARTDIIPVLGGLVVYLATASILTNARTRMWMVACLLVAALAHVVVGVIQFRNGNNFMPISFLQRFDYGHRASGFYVCPDHLAGLLEVLGIFGLSIVCWSRWPVWGKLLVGYATVACYFGVLITGSRGGYLSVAASLVTFAVLSRRLLEAAGGFRLMARIGGPVLIAAVLAMGGAFFVIHRSDALTERTNTALAAKDFRFAAWRAALTQSKLNPVFGTGSRTYLFYGRMFRSAMMQRDPIYAHNDYLQLLAEYGLVGVLAFLLFLAVHLRHGAIDAARLGVKRIAVSQQLPSNAMALNIAALCAIAAYAVHSIFDFNLHIPANVLLLAFVFGLLANSGVTYDGAPVAVSRTLIAGRIALALVAVVLGWQIWRFAPAEYYKERARMALRDYRFLTAIDYATKASRADPRDPEPFYYLGRARVLGGSVEKNQDAAASFYRAAVPAFERAVALAPLDETYLIELALTWDALKQFSEAEWRYDQAMALDPLSSSLREYYRAHLDQWKGGPQPPKS